MISARSILKEYLLLTKEQKILEDKLTAIKEKLQIVKNKALTYIREQDEEGGDEPFYPND